MATATRREVRRRALLASLHVRSAPERRRGDPGPPPHGHQGHLSGRVRTSSRAVSAPPGKPTTIAPGGRSPRSWGGGRKSDVPVQASLPGTGWAGVGCRVRGAMGRGGAPAGEPRWPGRHGSRSTSSIGCSASCPSVPTRARSSTAALALRARLAFSTLTRLPRSLERGRRSTSSTRHREPLGGRLNSARTAAADSPFTSLARRTMPRGS